MEIAGPCTAPEGEYIGIQRPTDTAEARRLAMAMASRHSFDESEAGKLGLVVTEISKNLLKHAGGGDVFLRILGSNGATGVEVLALDKGPGIDDVPRSFEDGYSTAGTPGTGLGAVARLSTLYDLYSRRGQGTVLMAQVWTNDGPGARTQRFQVGGISRALAGEIVCGDAWIFQERMTNARLLVADGLGHGPNAAAAAHAAVATARSHPGATPKALLEMVHAALRSTRGAAVAVAEVDPEARVVHFAGIGNISGVVIPLSGSWVRMVSHNGTAGMEARKVAEFTYPWSAGTLLLMHSDGITSNWSFENYPGLLTRHPSVVAGIVYRDFARGSDDATVVVARQEQAA